MSDELPLSDDEIFRALGMATHLAGIEQTVGELKTLVQQLADTVWALNAVVGDVCRTLDRMDQRPATTPNVPPPPYWTGPGPGAPYIWCSA